MRCAHNAQFSPTFPSKDTCSSEASFFQLCFVELHCSLKIWQDNHYWQCELMLIMIELGDRQPQLVPSVQMLCNRRRTGMQQYVSLWVCATVWGKSKRSKQMCNTANHAVIDSDRAVFVACSNPRERGSLCRHHPHSASVTQICLCWRCAGVALHFSFRKSRQTVQRNSFTTLCALCGKRLTSFSAVDISIRTSCLLRRWDRFL